MSEQTSSRFPPPPPLTHANTRRDQNLSWSHVAGVACFDDMGRGFATGSSYVRLRPCSHWLCLSCAQKMQMHVVGNARCPTCRDPALLWGVHNPQ